MNSCERVGVFCILVICLSGVSQVLCQNQVSTQKKLTSVTVQKNESKKDNINANGKQASGVSQSVKSLVAAASGKRKPIESQKSSEKQKRSQSPLGLIVGPPIFSFGGFNPGGSSTNTVSSNTNQQPSPPNIGLTNTQTQCSTRPQQTELGQLNLENAQVATFSPQTLPINQISSTSTSPNLLTQGFSTPFTPQPSPIASSGVKSLDVINTNFATYGYQTSIPTTNENGQNLPLNLQINVPAPTPSTPSITLLSPSPVPSSTSGLTTSARSRSKSKYLLPMLMIALLGSDDNSNSNCCCCNPCNCGNSIPIPFPIPMPFGCSLPPGFQGFLNSKTDTNPHDGAATDS